MNRGVKTTHARIANAVISSVLRITGTHQVSPNERVATEVPRVSDSVSIRLALADLLHDYFFKCPLICVSF